MAKKHKVDDDEPWRISRPQTPPEVEDLISNEFVRRIRDGGPQEIRLGDLPEVNNSWIGNGPLETARNVVNNLCDHRFGAGVKVKDVFAGPERNAGVEYLVTLNVPIELIGSCLGYQVAHFDKDTDELLQRLRRRGGWEHGIYKLSVQTPGLEKEMKLPDDLWRCDLFPCYVTWRNDDGKVTSGYLSREVNTNTTWRWADIEKNHDKRGRLPHDRAQERLEIAVESLETVRVFIEPMGEERLLKAKKIFREKQEGVGIDPDILAAAARGDEGAKMLKELLQSVKDEEKGMVDETWDDAEEIVNEEAEEGAEAVAC